MLFVLICFFTFSAASEHNICWHVPENVWTHIDCVFDTHDYPVVDNFSPVDVTNDEDRADIDKFFDQDLDQSKRMELMQKIFEMSNDERIDMSELGIYSNPGGGDTSDEEDTSEEDTSDGETSSGSTCECNFACCKAEDGHCCNDCLCHFVQITNGGDELRSLQLHTLNANGQAICHHTDITRVKISDNEDGFYKSHSLQSGSCN